MKKKKKYEFMPWLRQVDFVPCFESSVLKNLGFDEPCIAYYDYYNYYNHNKNVDLIINVDPKNKKNKNSVFDKIYSKNQKISAPLLRHAFRWFREEWNLVSWVYKTKTERYYINIISDEFVKTKIYYSSYEDAEKACLTELIMIALNSPDYLLDDEIKNYPL